MQLTSVVDDETACEPCRTDVWDVLWASDDPSSLAVMEKSKMLVIHGTEAEDPVRTNDYLLAFGNLEVSMLDAISLQAKVQVGLDPCVLKFIRCTALDCSCW